MYSHIEDKNYNHLVCVILGGSEKECKLHGLAHVGEHMCLLSCFDNDESYTTFGYTCIDHAVLYFASKKQDSLYKIQSMIEDKSIVREDRVEIAKHQVISECENLSSKICAGESAVRFITDNRVKKNELVDAIKPITAKFILESEEKLHRTIYEKDTGFCRLLNYLSGTVSVDKKIIDIMTPNYDRIIEIICDKLGIGVITGFYGSLYGKFSRNLLKQPTEAYNCKNYSWIRLFKPHGSINWISENGKEYLTNDYELLKEKAEYIEIVTPGSSKYKVGMTNNTFRCMREEFNELLNPRDNYSLLIYGYGFNDDHFDTALFDSFQKNVLILSRDVKPDIINKALEKKNITVFYHEDDREYMIYKSRKYTIDLPVWDINQFADLFIG